MAETASGERRDERALVDDAAARNVDERALGTERVDYGRGDEMAGLPPALAGDHQIIAAPRPLHRVRHVTVWRIRVSGRAAINYIHSHRSRAPRNPAPH